MENDIEEMEQDIMKVQQQIDRVEQDIDRVQQQIIRVEQQIDDVEEELKTAAPRDVARLRKKEEQLQKDKEQLREKEEHLWKDKEELREELLLLKGADKSGLSSGAPEKLWQELAEFLAEQKAKSKSKKSVQFSSMSLSTWDAIERQEGLNLWYKEIDPNPEHVSDLPAFSWDDRQERSQADKYIPHLNKIASGQKWQLIDAANDHPTLLSGFLGDWSFKGPTDVAFVHRKLLKFETRRGLKCIFQLKKDLRGGCEKAMIQTTIRLVMANVFSKQFSPVAVLTDLDDFWSLYWMDGSTIYWHKFESRASAVGYIEELLQDSDDDKMGIVDIRKRKMYEPPGMDNLNDLVGFLPDEEIQSAREQYSVQYSVQQLEKLLPIPLRKKS